MSLGPWEIALIFLVVLLVFGAKRIPEIARGLGKGIREFKDATNDIKQELNVSESSRQVPQQTGPADALGARRPAAAAPGRAARRGPGALRVRPPAPRA